MLSNFPLKRAVVLLNEGRRMPLVVKRFLWRWRGELVLFGLWCLKPAGYVSPVNVLYRKLIGYMTRCSGLFDESYYAEVNADVSNSGRDALAHYVAWGDKEGRRPNPVFDPAYYRANTNGYTRSVSALLHYIWVGCHRDFSPSAWFDNALYIQQNKDVALSGINPLAHFLRWGGQEGRSPSNDFDTRYYVQAYPDVAESGINPLLHYVLKGRHEGRWAKGEQPGTEVRPSTHLTGEAKEADIGVEQVLTHAPKKNGQPQVDVIMPVYRSRALTLRCINSVLSAHNETPYQIIVIDDASPEPELKRDLETLAEKGWISLVANRSNRGFVATANRGMRLHLDRDVILLNSDTEVYDGWLDRLHHHAYANEQAGSVTPLSNNATICSYPRFLHDNPYPLELPYSDLDRLCSEVNAGSVVRAPTGVGFCMYIRRQAINEIGFFDESAFGRGYGEENDWCQRAMEAGWNNLIAADVFVRHFGGASFQGEQTKRVRHALRTMARRHPTYLKQVENFISADPLAEARQNLDRARLKRCARDENVLMLCHSRGGGAERHLQEDAQAQRDRGRGVFFMRPVPGRPTHAYIQHRECVNMPNLPMIELADIGKMAERISGLGITCIHSHGLVDFEPSAAEYLHLVCDKTGIPLHVDIHDYKVICPRINLAKTNGLYCGEPHDEKVCNSCLKTEGNDFGVRNIRQWREQHHRVLTTAEEVYVPDSDVAERLQRYYPDVSCRILPHEDVEYQPRPIRIEPGERLRIGVIGAISRIKGYDVLLDCARNAKKMGFPIDYILMGYSMCDEALIRAGIRITGKYREEESLQKLQELRPHFVFLPALWPETYSYTLTIALRAGLPVFAFDIGAVASRLRAFNRDQGLMPMEWADKPEKINNLLLSRAECVDLMENQPVPCSSSGRI